MTEDIKAEALFVLQNERECVIRGETCDRDCSKCDLVMPSEKIISAYDNVILWLKQPHTFK